MVRQFRTKPSTYWDLLGWGVSLGSSFGGPCLERLAFSVSALPSKSRRLSLGLDGGVILKMRSPISLGLRLP